MAYVGAFGGGEGCVMIDQAESITLRQPLAFLSIGITVPGHDATSHDTLYWASVGPS